MSDFVSLALGIPSYVEGFVQTCRVVQRYRGLHREHLETILRAEFGSRKLAYYAELVSSKNPRNIETESQRLLEEALNHALNALDSVTEVVDLWTAHLDLNPSRSRGRIYVARMATALAERMDETKRGRRGLKSIRAAIGKKVSEAEFMVTGSIRINDAMEILERWTHNLSDILLISSLVDSSILHTHAAKRPSSLEDTGDEIMFVAKANERVNAAKSLVCIDCSFLTPATDINPKRPTGFSIIREGPYKNCLIDRRSVERFYETGKYNLAIQDTEKIARIFAEEHEQSVADVMPKFGFLRCRGWSEWTAPVRRHDLVFRLPPGTRTPRTLRDLLLEGRPQHTLEARLGFSIKLASLVLIIHSLGLVHKNIRPDAILVFEPLAAKTEDLFPHKLGAPYLAYFNRTRSDNVPTIPGAFNYSILWDILYVHPRHLMDDGPHVRYDMIDNIYSLGITLLEIALWKSLFRWNNKKQCYDRDDSVVNLSGYKYEQLFEQMGEPEDRNDSWMRRFDLVQLAEKEVPIIMGTAFKNIVVACLSFGESPHMTLEGEVRRTQSSYTVPKAQSVKFTQDVLFQLRNLRFSD